MKVANDRFKVQTFFDEDLQQRLIRVLDRFMGKTFLFHVDEIELINNKELYTMKKHLQKRMHLIKSGAYDTD